MKTLSTPAVPTPSSFHFDHCTITAFYRITSLLTKFSGTCQALSFFFSPFVPFLLLFSPHFSILPPILGFCDTSSTASLVTCFGSPPLLITVDVPQDSVPWLLITKQVSQVTVWPTLVSATSHADDLPTSVYCMADVCIWCPVDPTGLSKLDIWDWILLSIVFYLLFLFSQFQWTAPASHQPGFCVWFLIPLSPPLSYPVIKSYQIPVACISSKQPLFSPSSFLKSVICFWLFPFGLILSFIIFTCLYCHFSVIFGKRRDKTCVMNSSCLSSSPNQLDKDVKTK